MDYSIGWYSVFTDDDLSHRSKVAALKKRLRQEVNEIIEREVADAIAFEEEERARIAKILAALPPPRKVSARRKGRVNVAETSDAGEQRDVDNETGKRTPRQDCMGRGEFGPG